MFRTPSGGSCWGSATVSKSKGISGYNILSVRRPPKPSTCCCSFMLAVACTMFLGDARPCPPPAEAALAPLRPVRHARFSEAEWHDPADRRSMPAGNVEGSKANPATSSVHHPSTLSATRRLPEPPPEIPQLRRNLDAMPSPLLFCSQNPPRLSLKTSPPPPPLASPPRAFEPYCSSTQHGKLLNIEQRPLDAATNRPSVNGATNALGCKRLKYR